MKIQILFPGVTTHLELNQPGQVFYKGILVLKTHIGRETRDLLAPTMTRHRPPRHARVTHNNKQQEI